MIKTIDLRNRAKIQEMLALLQPETNPLWGTMDAQQMVEHLVNELDFTSGKKLYVYNGPADEAAMQKYKWIYTDAEIPKNLVLAPPAVGHRFTDLVQAKENLLTGLDDFDNFFADESITSDHGAYGAMDYREWLIWHGKHFAHHFNQFGLL